MHAMYMYKCKTGYNDTGLLRLCFSLLFTFARYFYYRPVEVKNFIKILLLLGTKRL